MPTIDYGWFRLHQDDCRKVMRSMPESSVDSIVTDPPYELGFMGKGWDRSGIANDPEMWREVLRVLKPGGHLLSFGGTRTFHRQVCAIEDAGLELRDTLFWVYGSGFPKSPNIDGGFGLALKPAVEPITMARKPLIGTVAATRTAFGTGALNIDGCRVPCEGGSPSAAMREAARRNGTALGRPGEYRDTIEDRTSPERFQTARSGEDLGRWPANLLHDGSDEVLEVFPDAPGQQANVSDTAPSEKTSNVYSRMARVGEASANSENRGAVGFKMKPGARRLDTGSAARFFYCAKAGKADRGEGNTHPTVKPTDLMRWLVRLVTPAGGLVLDPFNGSGSTGKAALLEGFRFIGIDNDEKSINTSVRRLIAAKWGEDFEEF